MWRLYTPAWGEPEKLLKVEGENETLPTTHGQHRQVVQSGRFHFHLGVTFLGQFPYPQREEWAVQTNVDGEQTATKKLKQRLVDGAHEAQRGLLGQALHRHKPTGRSPGSSAQGFV